MKKGPIRYRVSTHVGIHLMKRGALILLSGTNTIQLLKQNTGSYSCSQVNPSCPLDTTVSAEKTVLPRYITKRCISSHKELLFFLRIKSSTILNSTPV